MIEFHLNSRSGVAPYLQLIRQVRQALRLGLLRAGDQLPTVKEVAGSMAINPNTVLKAYRLLEYEGLVAAKPGVGTFVTKTVSDESVAAHQRLSLELSAWIGRAQQAGLDFERHRGAVSAGRPVRRAGGSSMTNATAAIEARGLGKRYGRRWALADCTLTIPAGHVAGLVGPNGAGKTTLISLATGMLAPTTGTVEVLGGRRPAVPISSPASATSRRTPRPTPG